MIAGTLSPVDVARIRRNVGKISITTLATVFGVDEGAIRAVLQQGADDRAPTWDSPLPAVLDFAAADSENASGVTFRAPTRGWARTSVRLHAMSKAALLDIARAVNLTPVEVLAEIDRLRSTVPLTRAVDCYILAWLASGAGAASLTTEVAWHGRSVLPRRPAGRPPSP